MQKIWVLLKIFQIFPMQLLEDFDIVVELESKKTAEKGRKLCFWPKNGPCRLTP
jgi:hypothetical protein